MWEEEEARGARAEESTQPIRALLQDTECRHLGLVCPAVLSDVELLLSNMVQVAASAVNLDKSPTSMWSGGGFFPT